MIPSICSVSVKNSSSHGVYRHRKHRSTKSRADGHHGQQSVVTNSEEEIHVASIAFAEQYSELKTVHDVFEYGCSISSEFIFNQSQ
ncbi:hypothetical protein AHF37_10914 [Paragonimus kellicotti]|nr:hypothetical protein AHF37_10913 [Paragonimus kellicotti]KAF6770870.1 hypothetical protein AHF37_10914 [Paragonimus kellicotti]